MGSKTNSEKEFGQCKNIPVNYLFGAFLDKDGKPIIKYSEPTDVGIKKTIQGYHPIPGIVLFTETMVISETQCQQSMQPWFTNYNGVLNHLKNDFSEGSRWYHLNTSKNHQPQRTFFPNVEQLSYFYAAAGNDWIKTVAKSFTNQENNQAVMLVQRSIPFEELESPKTDDEIKKELAIEQGVLDKKIINEKERQEAICNITLDETHPDITYRVWYERQKVINSTLYGFVIPQSRHIVFTFSHPKADQWAVSFWPHGEKELLQELDVIPDDKMNPNFFAAVFSASKSSLNKGIYTIQINSGTTEPFGEHWSKKTVKEQSYQLKANFRFDVKNLAGDFEIVNCDPITIEEGMLKQFPQTYNKLIKQAYLKSQGKSLPKDTIQNSGLKTVTSEIQLRKDHADLLNNFFTATSEKKQTSLIGKGVSAAIDNMPVSQPFKDIVNIAFQTNKFRYTIFDDMPKSLRNIAQRPELADKSLYEVIKKIKMSELAHWNYASASDPKKKIIDQFKEPSKGALTGKDSIPPSFLKKAVGFYDKISTPIDGVINVLNVVGNGHNAYTQFHGVDGKIKTTHDRFLNYHQQIHDWEEKSSGHQSSATKELQFNASSFKPNEHGNIRFTILFDYEKSLAKEQTSAYQEYKTRSLILDEDTIKQKNEVIIKADQQAIAQLVQFLNEHEELSIVLEGHTDPRGSTAYNLELSQDRADAVKALLTAQGIDAARISTQPLGESLLVDQDGNLVAAAKSVRQPDYEQCRRVEAKIEFFGTANYIPCREAMAHLEQSRDAGVLQVLEVEDAVYKTASDVWEMLKYTLKVVPTGYTQLASVIITVTEATYSIVKNIGAWLDTVALDQYFQTIIEQHQKLTAFQGASLANQHLLRRSINDSQDTPSTMYLNSQYRVRSEALYGLIGLITRASICTSNEKEFLEKIKDYHLDAYIDNFVLNDGWRFPLEPFFPITMDEFWLFAVKTMRYHSGGNYSWYGFDIHKKLLKEPKKDGWDMPNDMGMMFAQVGDAYNKANNIRSEQMLAQDILVNGTLGDAGKFGQHLYSRATNDVPKHQKADFQSCFPIHHLYSSDISGLATAFKTDFNHIRRKYYKHTAIYARPPKPEWTDPNKPPEWVLLKEYVKNINRDLSSFDQIRILVVFHTREFDKDGNTINKDDTWLDPGFVYPTSVQLLRTDFLYNLDGPKYRTLARRLDKGELLNDEADFANHVGYVVYPFYQFGLTTYSGTKPMAHSITQMLSEFLPTYSKLDEAHDSDGFEEAFDYWRLGGLDNMSYKFIAGVSDTTYKHPICVDSEKDEDEDEYSEYSMTLNPCKEIPSTNFYTSILEPKEYQWLPEARLLYSPFLSSGVQYSEPPDLFTEDEDVQVLMRIGGENGSDYVMPSLSCSDLINNDKNKKFGFNFESTVGLIENGGQLKIDDFDWNTSVEFIFIVTADEIDSDGYTEQQLNWHSVPFSTQMKELTGLDTPGPVISGKLSYLGIINNPSKDDTIFEISSKVPTELQPIIDIFSKKDDTAYILSGCNKLLSSNKRHLYASYYKCRYESLTGVRVNSLRPFSKSRTLTSDRVDLDTKISAEDSYFKVAFSNFKVNNQKLSSLSSDLITTSDPRTLLSTVFASYDASTYLPLVSEFHFKAPDNLLNAPWTKLPNNSEEMIKEARKFQKSTLLTDWHDKSTEEKNKLVKHWIEEDTVTQRQLRNRIFRG